MTGRERLLAALNLECADRVPISTYELVGYNSRSFENQDQSYSRLMQAIRELTDCVCMWDPGSNAAIAKTDHIGDFLETTAYPVDMEVTSIVQGDKTVTRRLLHTPKGDLTSTSQVFSNVHTVWKTEHWCKSINDVERLLSIPYVPVDYDFSDLSRVASEVRENGIIMSTVFDPVGWAADVMSFEDFLVWAFEEPDHFDRTLHRVSERVMENLRRMLDGHVVDLYRVAGPEAATPPYLPRASFERYVVPFVTRIVDLIHARGSRARIHCHGKIGSVLDLLAETGADALDPCEGPPDGDVTLRDAKDRIGDRMCLFGNIQLKLLERGTREEIRWAVRECMESAKAGGGYVIMPTAAPINTPLSRRAEDNFLCFIESALEFGAYGPATSYRPTAVVSAAGPTA